MKELIPKAKILLIINTTLDVIKMCFDEPNQIEEDNDDEWKMERIDADYEIDEVTIFNEIKDKLKSFKPDIVMISSDYEELARVGLLGDLKKETAAEVAHMVLKSKYKPKDILLFGASLTGGKSTDIESPIKIWQGDIEDLKAKRKRLHRILRERCEKRGLMVEKKI